jgi:tRNA U34 5-carboxymethylaminomethyl modifying GTPase MnmE/TrmE
VIAGWEFQLTDSAGLRATDDDLEARGIEKIAQAAATADLILEVVSAQPGEATAAPSLRPAAGATPHSRRVAVPLESVPQEPVPLEAALAESAANEISPVASASATVAPTLLLLNKIDLCASVEAAVATAAQTRRDRPAAPGSIWPVSARTRQGLDEVVAALVATVLPEAATRGLADPPARVEQITRPAAVVFCRSVYEWLHQWRQRLIATSLEP